MNCNSLNTNDLFTMYQDLYDTKQIIEKPFSGGEIKMLGFLCLIKDGMTAGELSKGMNVTTARIAQILNALEIKERIYRKTDSADKRVVYVFLTEKGWEYFNIKYNAYVLFLSKLFELLGEDETIKYIRLSKRIEQIAIEMGKNIH